MTIKNVYQCTQDEQTAINIDYCFLNNILHNFSTTITDYNFNYNFNFNYNYYLLLQSFSFKFIEIINYPFWNHHHHHH